MQFVVFQKYGENMKKIVCTIIMTLNIFVCHAHEIRQVNEMKELFDVVKTADSKTLVIFDIDMVLVQPNNPAFQMANMKRYSTVSKRIMKEVPPDKQMIFLSLMTTSSSPVLIDEKTPQYLQQIIQRGIPVIALTANLTGPLRAIPNMEQWRVDSLRKLKIDFSQTAPFASSLVFDNLPSYRGNFSTYIDGILFVNGTTVSKGDAFLSFLEKSGFMPNRVIFIDDREENLKSVETALQKVDASIEYQGLHYLGAKDYPSKTISEEEFESSWKKLAAEARAST